MKDKKKIDAVEMMRKIRDQVDREIKGMNHSQLKKYLEQNIDSKYKKYLESVKSK